MSNPKNPNSKWNDPLYHALEFMRELAAAEQHLIQYINTKEQNEVLSNALVSIRNVRKQTEDDLYGRE